MNSKKYPTAEPFLPDSHSISALQKAAQGCQGCPLYLDGTQTVFGEGPKNARLILVGEQPGRAEDREGRPFVGPAGKHLDQALREAGLNRDEIYVTNAVKHFKNEGGVGKTPLVPEIQACRPWLEREIEILEPELVIALGATAARSLLKMSVAIGEYRGKFLRNEAGLSLLVTYHPSAALRHPIEAERRTIYEQLVEDLSRARQFLDDLHAPGGIHPI